MGTDNELQIGAEGAKIISASALLRSSEGGEGLGAACKRASITCVA